MCFFLLYFQRAYCAYCHDRIWGLGRQGFKCTQCKLLVHKKCHKLIRVACDVTDVANLPLHRRQTSSIGSANGTPEPSLICKSQVSTYAGVAAEKPLSKRGLHLHEIPNNPVL